MIERSHELVDWNFDVPIDFFEIPLDASDGVAWAHSVVAEEREQSANPGVDGQIVDDLVELRRRLLAEGDPFLSAWVSIRPEVEFTIGCILTAEQFSMDPDDGPDSFETMLTEGVARLAPGRRTRTADVWRTRIDAGDVVAMYHRFDVRGLDSDEEQIQQRTIFGVFPEDSSDMIRFVFNVSDLLTFDDMSADTQEIVSTLTVRLGEKVS